jgi:hypothetical protein
MFRFKLSIARGSDLIEFLNRVLRRTGGTLDVEASLPNVVCISKGRRQPVAPGPFTGPGGGADTDPEMRPGA